MHGDLDQLSKKSIPIQYEIICFNFSRYFLDLWGPDENLYSKPQKKLVPKAKTKHVLQNKTHQKSNTTSVRFPSLATTHSGPMKRGLTRPTWLPVNKTWSRDAGTQKQGGKIKPAGHLWSSSLHSHVKPSRSTNMKS